MAVWQPLLLALLGLSPHLPWPCRATSIPTPVSVANSEKFRGIDGSWSTFLIGVGTHPPQYVELLPSTISSFTMVVGPVGCPVSEFQNAVKLCETSHGSIFNQNLSSSWVPKGVNNIYLDTNLFGSCATCVPTALYGLDTIQVGQTPTSPVVSNSVIASFGPTYDSDFYVGLFPLNPYAVNWTATFKENTPGTLTLMKQNNQIPSLSFGYTAGAIYRHIGVGGSLTLGGYDQGRFEPNDVRFIMGTSTQPLLVGLQAITGNSVSQTNIKLLPGGIYANIDSTASGIWLPTEACALFEQAFGLTYNETYDLYLVNDTLRQQLLASKPAITFTLGASDIGGETVNITLPFPAFDLKTFYPYHGLDTSYLGERGALYYFPLRRATNADQYTLGRTFLQEAYISVDWERNLFNVSKCVWTGSGTRPADIVALLSTDASYSIPSSSSSLSTGAIAGIAVGIVVLAAIILLVALMLLHRRRAAARREAKRQADDESDRASSTSQSDIKKEHPLLIKPELDANQTYSGAEVEDKAATAAAIASSTPRTPTTPGWVRSPEGTLVPSLPDADSATLIGGRQVPVEAAALERPIYEMPGDAPTRGELPGVGQTGPSAKEEAIERERVYNGVDPVEEAR